MFTPDSFTLPVPFGGSGPQSRRGATLATMQPGRPHRCSYLPRPSIVIMRCCALPQR